MIRSEFRGILLASLLALGATAVHAQLAPAAPVPGQQLRTAKTRLATFQGQVLAADAAHIIVQRRDDPRFIRTFTYSSELRKKMTAVLERGGYQFGDRVRVRYEPRTEVAYAIKGKPSKRHLAASLQ